LVAIAQKAETLGCDSVWVSDHLVWPTEIQSSYPYAEHGSLPVPPDTPFYDPLLILAAISTSTTRLRLATGVFILPLCEALAVARAVATLDSLSDGRVIFGVGIGWMKEEFVAAGADFDCRAERTDEMIESLRVLWGAGPHGYDGRFVRFLPVHLEPTPPQEGNVPIHVGGETPAALERAARLGNGWISMQQTVDSARRRIQQLEIRRAVHARETLPFEISVLIPWPADSRAPRGVSARWRQPGPCLPVEKFGLGRRS
jgi:probable F420-dependent oxidoreductase